MAPSKQKVGGSRKRLVVGGMVLGAAAVLYASGADARLLPREVAAPRRPDIVATFSSGTVLMEVGDRTLSTTVRSGRMSLSTNDAGCDPSPEHPCEYTVNELQLVGEDFSFKVPVGLVREKTIQIRDLTVTNTRAATRQRDVGAGINIRPLIPFWLTGLWNGEPMEAVIDPEPEDVVEIVDLVVTPQESEATVFGSVTATTEDGNVTVTMMTTADTPFANRPPFADAGPDVTAETSCIAEVSLDASGTVDPDGNLKAGYYTINGHAVGRSDEPIVLPPGDHRLRLVAVDTLGAKGFDETLATVVDDGRSEPLEGTAVVSFELPAGTVPEDLALASIEDLEAQPGTEVWARDGTAGAVAGLESLVLGVESHVGDAYAGTSAVLRNRARVEGALHANGTLDTGRDVRLEEGVVRDGFLPGAVTSFHVPNPPSGGSDIVAPPGGVRVLEPGTYGAVRVKPRATLELEPGVYTMRSLHIAPDATLLTQPFAGGAPTILAVTEEVAYQGTAASRADAPSLLLAYLGTERWHVHAPFQGWVIAPEAEVVLHPSEHRGAFFARSLRVLPFTTIHHEPFPAQFIRDARNACALEPFVQCVRRRPGGSTAVFGYRSALPRFGATVPVGPFNRVEPGEPWQGQPVGFFPRERLDAFEVAFEDRVTWTLGGRRAVATPEVPSCP